MARIEKNHFLHGISGGLGKYIIKVRNGKTYISKRPKKPTKESDAQRAGRELFCQASEYAKAALQDPVLHAFYASITPKGQNTRNVAMADFWKPPVIENINTSSYHGNPGDTISMIVTDNGKVVSVSVCISKDDIVLEEGNAVMQNDGVTWVYIASTQITDVDGAMVTVRARDLAGRETVM